MSALDGKVPRAFASWDVMLRVVSEIKQTISVSDLASLSDPEASNRCSTSAYIALLPVAIDGPRSQLLPSILNAF